MQVKRYLWAHLRWWFSLTQGPWAIRAVVVTPVPAVYPIPLSSICKLIRVFDSCFIMWYIQRRSCRCVFSELFAAMVAPALAGLQLALPWNHSLLTMYICPNLNLYLIWCYEKCNWGEIDMCMFHQVSSLLPWIIISNIICLEYFIVTKYQKSVFMT